MTTALAIAERTTALLTTVVDTLPLMVATFGENVNVPIYANVRWRAHFEEPPRRLRAALGTTPRRSSEPVHVDISDDVGTHVAHYSAVIHTLVAPRGRRERAVVCNDITDEVIALRLGAHAGALVWSITGVGDLGYRNVAWATTIGTTTEWAEIFAGEDLDRYGGALRQARNGAVTLEARMRSATGYLRWHRINIVFAADESRWYACASDIHEAYEANRQKDAFLAIVSHELRTPVTTMLLWEKVLREQSAPSVRAQALDAIRQSAQLQARLVGDLLDVSRAISGKLFVDLRPLALGDVINAAVEAARPIADARNIELVCDCRRVGTVLGDMARLRQIVDNVIANALQFTEAGGRVTLTLRTGRREAVIEITDTGRGIAEEHLQRIFEPFYQSGDGLTARRGGLGLGLAIARQLVQLHGGSLTAASPGPGRGSTFTIRIPLATKRRSRTPSPVPVTLFGRRVLLVDDDPRVRDALALLLGNIGALVTVAGSAAEARSLLARCMPDVIVCDIGMPDEDGYSFIRSLRATGCKTPAIALTAYAMQADADRALEAGFTMHLAKPLQFDRLVDGIGTILSGTIA